MGQARYINGATKKGRRRRRRKHFLDFIFCN